MSSSAFLKKFINDVKIGLRGVVARGLEIFSSLEIKFKLSINIAIIVVLVIFIYSLLILPVERRVLKKATENTCSVLLRKLSQNVRDAQERDHAVAARRSDHRSFAHEKYECRRPRIYLRQNPQRFAHRA
jgi:hypothetical protein